MKGSSPERGKELGCDGKVCFERTETWGEERKREKEEKKGKGGQCTPKSPNEKRVPAFEVPTQ